MKLLKLLSMSAAVVAAMSASQAVYAHASFDIGSSAGNPVWLNGLPASGVETPQYPNSSINIPQIAFAGIHGATASNARVIETGAYGPAYNASTAPTGVTAAQLGGVIHNGVTPAQGNTLFGQAYNLTLASASSKLGGPSVNEPSSAPSQASLPTVSVTQGSAANGIYNAGNNTFNTGNLYLNPYAGSGSVAGTSAADGEYNIIQSTHAQYLNFAIAPDTSSALVSDGLSSQAGQDLLTYTLYQGVATGAGLSGLVELGSGQASSIGGEVDFSVNLQGDYLNNDPTTGGQFTLVVGDASQSSDSTNSATYVSAANYDPYISIAMWETGTGSANTTAGYDQFVGAGYTTYQETGANPLTNPLINPSAVPVPGAVWMFGSVLAGWMGFRRRQA